MAYETKNVYKVTFKDGTSFESNGNASSDVKEFSVNEEFKWVGFHISKEVLAFGKQLSDVVRIDYTLSAACH